MALEAEWAVVPEAALEAECADKIRKEACSLEQTKKNRAANGMAAEWRLI